MGGSGSGRRYHCGAKNTTTDYRSLDIRRFHREKLIFAGSNFEWSWYRREEKVASISVYVKAAWIQLRYQMQRRGETEWIPKDYSIYLDWTDCHFGGQRPWFRCPALGCGRRVAILYSSEIYICRHCHRLAYESQREKRYDRLARRADKIRERLGWEPGILNGSGWQKPKGMHWKTFQRLVAEHDRLVEASLRGMAVDLRLPMASNQDWV